MLINTFQIVSTRRPSWPAKVEPLEIKQALASNLDFWFEIQLLTTIGYDWNLAKQVFNVLGLNVGAVSSDQMFLGNQENAIAFVDISKLGQPDESSVISGTKQILTLRWKVDSAYIIFGTGNQSEGQNVVKIPIRTALQWIADNKPYPVVNSTWSAVWDYARGTGIDPYQLSLFAANTKIPTKPPTTTSTQTSAPTLPSTPTETSSNQSSLPTSQSSSASIGQSVLDAMDKSNMKYSEKDGDNYSDMAKSRTVAQTSAIINLWDGIGAAILSHTGPSIEYRQIRLYDGSPKRSTPSESHVDAFIPELYFHTPPPNYTEYARNKTDITRVPVFSLPDVLDEVKSGYRVVIKDVKVLKNSYVHITIIALDLNEENDLPDTYEHISPGSYYVINQIDGEFQLFFENKGAYLLNYTISTGEINKDNKPTFIAFKDVP